MEEALTAFFHSLHGTWAYLFLFLSSLMENLFPPMPGDTFMVLGAFLVGKGQLGFFPSYCATTAGSILGFMILYGIGYQLGQSYFDKERRYFKKEHFLKIESWFNKYGIWVIAINRFLAGFRAVVSLAAGIVHYKPRTVLGLGLLSCLAWNGLLMLAGIWIGENWSFILKHYQRIVFIIIASVIIFFWIRRIVKHKMSQESSS